MSDPKTMNPAEERRLEISLSAPDQRPWLIVRIDVLPPGAEMFARAPDGSVLTIRDA